MEDLKHLDRSDFVDPAVDLTRRQWILRLGEFVALAGVSGVVPLSALSEQELQMTHALLPPGLYEPSQDHLVHALSSGGKNWTPPAGSETEFAAPSPAPYQPKFFSSEDFKVVGRLIEVLLGKVDPAVASEVARWFDLRLETAPAVREAALQLDPMQRALAVAYYGEEAVRELEILHPDAVARAGVRALQDLSNKLQGRDFLQLIEAEQSELLINASKAESGSDVRRFFDLARSEAIRGYYTSAAGLKDLDFRGNAYYGDCPGCESKP